MIDGEYVSLTDRVRIIKSRLASNATSLSGDVSAD